MNPGDDLNRPGPPRPYRAPTSAELSETARDRGFKGSLWASVSMVLFLCGALATWGQYRSPGGSATPSLVLGPVSWVLHLSGIAAAVIVVVYVLLTLFALRDRALAWSPPLARGAKSISNAHLRPVLNLTGPVTVLMETGVPRTAVSVGAVGWWFACLAAPFAVVMGYRADTAAEIIRVDVIAALTLLAVAVAGRGLDFVLRPGPRRRYFALPGRDNYGTVPFWERGIDPEPPTGVRPRHTGEPPSMTVEAVVEDPVEKLFIKDKDR